MCSNDDNDDDDIIICIRDMKPYLEGLFYTSRRLPFIIVLATMWFSLDSRFYFLHAVARTSGRSSAKLDERRE